MGRVEQSPASNPTVAGQQQFSDVELSSMGGRNCEGSGTFGALAGPGEGVEEASAFKRALAVSQAQLTPLV